MQICSLKLSQQKTHHYFRRNQNETEQREKKTEGDCGSGVNDGIAVYHVIYC
jgi:hypothetical protein